MTLMILGLLLVLGVHSVRLFADGWRARMIARMGRIAWMAMYSLVSLVGFAFLVWGFAVVREQPLLLWSPLPTLRVGVYLLTLLAFVLLTAAYVPRNAIKARLHHPLVLGVMAWALAHLLATGTLAHMILFGTMLLWAVVSFRASRLRDQREGTVYPAGTPGATALTWGLGGLSWAVFALWLHGLLIGIRPLSGF